MANLSLEDVRLVTPARAVLDEELVAALATCLQHVEHDFHRGIGEGGWHDELQRLLSTYAVWATRHVLRAFEADRG